MKKMKLRIKEKLNMIGYASGSMIRVYENFAGFYLIFYLTKEIGILRAINALKHNI